MTENSPFAEQKAGADPFSVVRIEHDGPAGVGLTEWEKLDPATLASGEPVQRGHFYGLNEESGYSMGVWDCTAFDDAPGPYPVDEYMVLLEGSVIMAQLDGTETVINAGDAFVLPRGLDCQWKMPGYVRKIFMIVEGDGRAASSNPSHARVTVPSFAPLSSPSEGAVSSHEQVFLSADGRMGVQRIDFHHAVEGPVPLAGECLVTVLEGSVEIEGHQFAKGDSFQLLASAKPAWKIAAGTRLILAAYTA